MKIREYKNSKSSFSDKIIWTIKGKNHSSVFSVLFKGSHGGGKNINCMNVNAKGLSTLQFYEILVKKVKK